MYEKGRWRDLDTDPCHGGADRKKKPGMSKRGTPVQAVGCTGRWSVRGCIPTLERGNDILHKVSN